MKSVRFECEVVTPMFLSGADPAVAELRPPSIRGAMRFWFRAMTGLVVGGNLSALHTLEKRVFGHTESRSPFRVRISPPPEEQWKPGEHLPGGDGEALNYLSCQALFDAFGRLRRAAIKPSSTFTVTFQFRDQDEHLRPVVLATFWMLSALGALGSRTRRGFGGIAVSSEEPESSLKFSSASSDMVPEFIQQNLGDVFAIFREFVAREIGRVEPSRLIPEWTSLSQIGLYRSQAFGTWGEALRQVGLSLSEFRRWRAPDYQALKDFIDPRKAPAPVPATVRRAAFGLPMTFFYPSIERLRAAEELCRVFTDAGVDGAAALAGEIAGDRDNKSRIDRASAVCRSLTRPDLQALFKRTQQLATVRVRRKGADRREDRRASPLLFRVLRTTDQLYCVLALFLPTESLLGRGGTLQITSPANGTPREVDPPDPPFGAIANYLADQKWTRVL
ncbi:MAG: type III-B CRISPR module RAMP protein Cmr1 [Deltaproteobacteria bacterium]|nr:type III-B CRISPR module RAMP protein Cmr1 [Deltaproteobacteria bacterium]